MLVLSRKKGEVVRIGGTGNIRVSVVAIKPDKVRLGFEAPKDVPIYREEIWKAAQKKLMAQQPPQDTDHPDPTTATPGPPPL